MYLIYAICLMLLFIKSQIIVIVIAWDFLIIFREGKSLFSPAGFLECENLARTCQKCLTEWYSTRHHANIPIRLIKHVYG